METLRRMRFELKMLPDSAGISRNSGRRFPPFGQKLCPGDTVDSLLLRLPRPFPALAALRVIGRSWSEAAA